VSRAFGKDLRGEFRELGFPVEDRTFEEMFKGKGTKGT
jgi:hypothetical protein